MEVLVQNPPISRVGFSNPRVMERFRTFLSDSGAEPLRHQAEAFGKVLAGEAVRLVAGTASGKTLSVALPLFEKLACGEVTKVLFFYPTLALMEDQKRVMDRLSEVYGSEEPVGIIRGGMPRSSLLSALGRSVIVATPDAAYWFLRKNVKYSHLLIYGLLLADEIVVDEAHLFAGLSAQNLAAFLDRLGKLREHYLGAAARVHLLTATWPKDGTLEKLSPNAHPITGDSLVGDVSFDVLRVDTARERSELACQAALDLLNAGYRKVLLVSNSARNAHATFDAMTSAAVYARRPRDVPDEFKLDFGVLDAREALKLADDAGLLKEAKAKQREEIPLRARKIGKAAEVGLRAEVVIEAYGAFLERVVRDLKSEVRRIARRGEAISPASLELRMGLMSLDRLRRLGALNYCQDYVAFKELIESRANRAQANAEQAVRSAEGEEGIRMTVPDMPELEDVLRGISVSGEFLQEFRRGLVLSGESACAMEELPQEIYRGVKVPIAQFMGWFDGEDRRKLRTGVLENAEHWAVRGISSREDGAISILYSGSMPRHAREGLIPLFGNLQVPVVLVSTSAVEVGVDFDADALVTEECSGSSFLQRFGRVGRRPGMDAQVKLFLGAESYTALKDEFDGHDVVSRTDFSEAITRILPERLSLRKSRYIEAVQTAVTYQIGEVGREVADHNPRVEELLEELRRSEVEFSYGLRGTMPDVQLREGISKNPFYALRFADSERIFPPDSPFELARLDRAFDEIIYTSWEDQRDVFVDLERTWPFMRSMAYLNSAGDLKVASIPSAWLDVGGLRKTLSQVEFLRAKMKVVPSAICDELGQRLTGLRAGALAHPEALLFYGDIVLGIRASDPEIPDRAEPVPYRAQDQSPLWR